MARNPMSAAARLLALTVVAGGATLAAVPTPASASDIAPAAVSYASAATSDVVAWAEYGQLYFDSNSGGNSGFFAPQVVAAGGASNPSVISTATANVVIASVGSTLYEFSQPFGTTGWTQRLMGLVNYSHGASVTLAGTTLVAVARGNDGSLNYFVLPKGGSSWGHTEVTGANTVINNPSVAWSGSTVLVAYSAPGGAVRFFWHPANGGWNPEAVTLGASIAGSPSITWRGSSSVGGAEALIAFTSPKGALEESAEAAGAPTWSGPFPLEGAGSVLGNPSAFVNTNFGIAYTGQNGGLNYLFFDSNTLSPGWVHQSIPTAYLSDPDPSVAWNGSGTMVVDHNYTGQLDFYYQPAGQTAWSHQSIPVSVPG